MIAEGLALSSKAVFCPSVNECNKIKNGTE